MISEGTMDFTRKEATNHLCYIQAITPSAFFQCPKIVNGAKLKSKRLHYLEETISIQNSIQSTGGLLLVTLTQISRKREQTVEWEGMKNPHLDLDGSMGKVEYTGMCLEKQL